MSTFEEKLAEVEAEFEDLELRYTELKAKRASVLRERPCDFYLQYQTRLWLSYSDSCGQKTGSFGWGNVDASNKAVHRFLTYKSARRHADYLQTLENKESIEVCSVPRS